MPNYHARFKTVTVLVTSTLILAFSGYHTLFGNRVLSEFVVYFIVPLGLIVLILRENPLRYGLKPGDWRRGLAYTAGGVVLIKVQILRQQIRQEHPPLPGDGDLPDLGRREPVDVQHTHHSVLETNQP